MSAQLLAADRAGRLAIERATPVGPAVAELWQRFPPRPVARTWPATEQHRDELMARLVAAPVKGDEAGQRRWSGMGRLLGWLIAQPGETWQQRWLASGADEMGNADWWRPVLTQLRRSDRCGVSTSSNLRVCAQMLISADAIRPSLGWVLTPRTRRTLSP